MILPLPAVSYACKQSEPNATLGFQSDRIEKRKAASGIGAPAASQSLTF
jgi:hypothetical protein